jgi:hypothetical protein
MRSRRTGNEVAAIPSPPWIHRIKVVFSQSPCGNRIPPFSGRLGKCPKTQRPRLLQGSRRRWSRIVFRAGKSSVRLQRTLLPLPSRRGRRASTCSKKFRNPTKCERGEKARNMNFSMAPSIASSIASPMPGERILSQPEGERKQNFPRRRRIFNGPCVAGPRYSFSRW